MTLPWVILGFGIFRLKSLEDFTYYLKAFTQFELFTDHQWVLIFWYSLAGIFIAFNKEFNWKLKNQFKTWAILGLWLVLLIQFGGKGQQFIYFQF